MGFVLVRIDTLEELPIDGEEVFVGSAEWKVDLCLAGESVDEVHCELASDSHGIRVESLSPAGVLVNGQTIQSALLFANDQLTIGAFEFQVQRAGGNTSRPVRQLPATLHAGISIAPEDDDEDMRQEPFSSVPPADADGEPVADDANRNGLWQVRLGSLELGPMGWAEVGDMLQRGELSGADTVCRSGSSDWQPIRSLAGARPSTFVPSEALRSEPGKPPDSSSARREDSRQAEWPVQATPCARPPVTSQATFDSRPDHANEPPVPNPSAVAVVEPQYFIQSRSGEEGPLPRHCVQELISRGELAAESPVRLEWNNRWSTAIDLGFAYPNGNQQPCEEHGGPAETRQVSPEHTRGSHGGSVSWMLMAPLFYTRSFVYSLRSLPLKHLIALLLACGTVGFAAQQWMNRRARTALTGTVMLDEKPLGNVVITLTGMRSGEVAAGVADGKGQFRILTISGTLTPGPYRITVRPQAGSGAVVPHGDSQQVVPERYALLATSDVTIDVTAEHADYSISLTRLASPAAVQYGRRSPQTR
jgi:hypothetical protein